jgi:hypothetical protein
VWLAPGAVPLGRAPGAFCYGYYTMHPVRFLFRLRSALVLFAFVISAFLSRYVLRFLFTNFENHGKLKAKERDRSWAAAV